VSSVECRVVVDGATESRADEVDVDRRIDIPSADRPGVHFSAVRMSSVLRARLSELIRCPNV
jgi:hypothetical protein